MAGLMDDYSTADVLARMPSAPRMTERERRRLMQRERAGIGLTDDESRLLENDEARRGAVADPVAQGGLGLLAELTGVPSIQRGAGNISRAVGEGDLLRGAGGAGEMALGLIPGAALTRTGGRALQAAYSSIPRAGATGAALTLPMAMTESAEAQQAKKDTRNSNWPATTQKAAPQPSQPLVPAAAAADPLAGLVAGNPTLEARYKLLMQKEADAKASIPGVGRASSDSIRQKASEEAATIRSDLFGAIDRANADKKSGETTEANKNKSVRELYSEYMPYIPVATSVLGGVGGGLIKGMYAKVHNAKAGYASDSWKNAVEKGDKVGAQTAQSELQGLMSKGPGGTLPAVGFGGALGFHNGLLPEEIDLARAKPGSKLADDVWQRLTDAQGMGKRLGFGALAGAAPAFSTAEIVGAAMKRAPKTYGPETASLASRHVQSGVDDVTAIGRYEAARAQTGQDARMQGQRFDQEFQVGGVKSRAGLAGAEQDARMQGQRFDQEFQLGGVKNRAGLAGAEADAQAQLGLLAQQRQSAANAQQLGGVGLLDEVASAAPSAAPSIPRPMAQSQQRQSPQPEPVQNLPLPPPSAEPTKVLAAPGGDSNRIVPEGMRPNPKWEPRSDAARDGILEHLEKGGNLGKGQAGSLTSTDLMGSINDSALKRQSAQGQMARLREILAFHGVDPLTATRGQVEAIFKMLPKGYFSAPPIAIGGGLGLMASEWPDRQ